MTLSRNAISLTGMLQGVSLHGAFVLFARPRQYFGKLLGLGDMGSRLHSDPLQLCGLV